MPMGIKLGVAIITSEKHRQIDFKGLDLIECLNNYRQRFITLNRRQ